MSQMQGEEADNMRWRTQGCATEELMPYYRFVFKNSKVRFGILALFPRKFCQASEIDQELKCKV
jgi:hypothetical protein